MARFTRASLNPALRWADVIAVGVLAGIGFTVSLLIAELAFEERPAAADRRQGRHPGRDLRGGGALGPGPGPSQARPGPARGRGGRRLRRRRDPRRLPARDVGPQQARDRRRPRRHGPSRDSLAPTSCERTADGQQLRHQRQHPGELRHHRRPEPRAPADRAGQGGGHPERQAGRRRLRAVHRRSRPGVPGVRVRARRRRLRDRRRRAAGVGRLPDRGRDPAPGRDHPRAGRQVAHEAHHPAAAGDQPGREDQGVAVRHRLLGQARLRPGPRHGQRSHRSPRRDPPRPRGGRPGRGAVDAPGRARERLPVPRRRDGRGPPGPAAARLPDVLVDLAPRPAGPGRGRLPRGGHGPARLRRLRPPAARLRPVHPLRGRQRRDPLPGLARRRRGGARLGRVPGVDGRRHAPGGDPRRSSRCRCRTRAGCGPPCWATPPSAGPRPTPSATRCRPPPSATCWRTGPPRSGDLLRAWSATPAWPDDHTDGDLPRGHAAAQHRALRAGVPPVGAALGAAARRHPVRQADEGTRSRPRSCTCRGRRTRPCCPAAPRDPAPTSPGPTRTPRSPTAGTSRTRSAPRSSTPPCWTGWPTTSRS